MVVIFTGDHSHGHEDDDDGAATWGGPLDIPQHAGPKPFQIKVNAYPKARS